MLISIIIPAFNCEKTILNTIESIKKSGINDYEILIIDDGSTDNTAAICDGLSASNDNVRCIHQKNAGVSATRNRGIDEAHGEYVWFVDADDIVEPINFGSIYHAFSDNADCVIFGMKFISMRKGRIILQEDLLCEKVLILTPESIGAYFCSLFKRNYFSSVCNKFIRKKILTENKISFDSTLINYEDLHFSVILMSHCKKIVAFPEAYYDYFNEFGQDRTVGRVQTIQDIIAYTDKIVDPFYTFDHQLSKNGYSSIKGLSPIVLWLYMEAAYFKLQTADKKQIELLCSSVQINKNIKNESQSIEQLSKSDQRLYRWMMNNSFKKISAFMRYRALRKIGSRFYRIARSYLGV